MKRISFSEEAKADISAMNILSAIHHLAETGAGRVKMLQDEERETRLRVGDYRVRFTVKNRKDAYR